MRVFWPMTFDTFSLYIDIIRDIQHASDDSDLIKLEALKDQLRALPGHPIHTDQDEVVPRIVTDKMLNRGRVYSLPGRSSLN